MLDIHLYDQDNVGIPAEHKTAPNIIEALQIATSWMDELSIGYAEISHNNSLILTLYSDDLSDYTLVPLCPACNYPMIINVIATGDIVGYHCPDHPEEEIML